jgi:hypothetical protein
MVRPSSPDGRQVRGLVVLLLAVFAAFWMNTRRPATADRNRTLAASPASTPSPVPVVICAVCGKPITGPVMVRRYDDGATDRIHPACYKRERTDPQVKVGR